MIEIEASSIPYMSPQHHTTDVTSLVCEKSEPVAVTTEHIFVEVWIGLR